MKAITKQKIKITCKYEVYPEEWEVIVSEINKMLRSYDDAKFINLKAEIIPD